MVLQTDVGAYGRVPEIWAQVINTIRVAYGDFSVIDPFQTFDYLDTDLSTEHSMHYKHSISIVWISFVTFIIGSVFLFLMLMNFIIAVICDTYNKVKALSVPHDYK